jgi:hypothetical protein
VVSIFLKGGSVPICAGMLVSEKQVLTSLECTRTLRTPAGTNGTTDGEDTGGTPAPDGEGMAATARIGNSTFMVHTPHPPLLADGRRAAPYRGTSLIRNRAHLGPYSRTMPRALW